MNAVNYLNIPTTDKNKYIYRIIPIKRLYQLFGTQRNVLVKPNKWQDPFENLISKTIHLKLGKATEFPYRENFFGQCWTFKHTSDALWRIYSPDTEAVRIRSKIKILAESLSRGLSPSILDTVFIGRVQYLTVDKIIALVKKVKWMTKKPEIRSIANTLLFKRLAFAHEREVRLLLFRREKLEDNIFTYQFNPHQVIDQIMIDPRMSEIEALALRFEIREKAEFIGEIKRSLLYAPPPEIVISPGG